MRAKTMLVAAGLLALASTPMTAQQVDMEAMARWSSAKVVRYHIVGAYERRTVIAFKTEAGRADVTDRVVVDVEWDLQAGQIVGQPKIQNAKSEVKNLSNIEPACALPVPKGAYEHIEVTRVEFSERDRVDLIGVTSFPDVEITDCRGSTERRTVAARQEPSVVYLPILSPVMLAMPSGATGNMSMTVSPDKKSFILKLDGWTWTYTPVVVS